MRQILISLFTVALAWGPGTIQSQCEANTTLYLTDYMFTPNNVTIALGESVAFVNAEGTHNVDGTSPNNPASFFLGESEGTIDGVCMGVVTFDVPGTYEFSSSIGLQAELGMVGTITVYAVTLADQLNEIANGDGDLAYLESWQSAYAMNAYFNPSASGGESNGADLNGADVFTLFLPTDAAIVDLIERMNLSQFGVLGFVDMVPALQYHMVPGLYMAADLANGMVLPTVEGQSVTISVGEQGGLIEEANIIASDITASNGVIHIIDKTLAPPGYPGATVLDVIMRSDEHTLFEQAIFNEGLDDELRSQPILTDDEFSPGPFTVFAPTDQALIAYAAANGFADVNGLLASQDMDDIVNLHIVEAAYESSDFFENMFLQSINNETLVINTNDDGITVNASTIGQFDLLAYNGVVHSMNDLIPYEIPSVEGTCGAWTVNMFSLTDTSGDPWQGGVLEIYVDGVLIASESPNSPGVDSFSFPADAGTNINAVLRGPSGNQAFEIENESGFIIYSSVGDGNTEGPRSIYGLRPCDESPSSCGPIEIFFVDGAQEGWFGGSMNIFSGSDLVTSIPFDQSYNPFWQKSVMVNIESGPLDFIVEQPFFYPDQGGYAIYNEEGAVLVDETSDLVPPSSSLGLEVCPIEASSVSEESGILGDATIYPNPTSGPLYLSGVEPNTQWEASLRGCDGKWIASFQGEGSGFFDLDGIAAGLYSLHIVSLDGTNRLFRVIHE